MSTREAIEASIRKWERIKKAIEEESGVAEELLEGPCPLCEERRIREGGVNVNKVKCTGCVIEEKTGQGHCFNTPYYAIYGEVMMLDRDAHENVQEQDKNLSVPLLKLVDEMLSILASTLHSEYAP